ncbi:hypothetical protein C8N41_1011403 [Winogradskyella sediminis]|nr:hypothetical protein C8N41_1011403 [Winogradskyella sediminis]
MKKPSEVKISDGFFLLGKVSDYYSLFLLSKNKFLCNA